MGAFQEGSEDLHALLGTLADSQLRAKGLARGRKEGTDQERSIILAGLRRALSMAAAKANSACLLNQGGGGAQADSQEKAWVKREEERKAFWHAKMF